MATIHVCLQLFIELAIILSGMIAGCFGVLFSTPFDCIRTNLQGRYSHLYKGTMDCARKIHESCGINGFYRGIFPRIVRVGIESG